MRPQVEIKASSTITNPHYTFPDDRRVQVYPAEDETKGPIIVELGKFSFTSNGISLLFNDDKVIVFEYPDNTAGQNHASLIEPILSFIKFKTFINYNLYGFPDRNSNSLWDMAPETISLKINLGQIIRKEISDEIRKGFYHEIKPCQLVLKRQDIADFLSIVNYNLYLAICYYLIGCENIRYFLIEYYKSIEAVRNFFENEKEMRIKMEPYGFTWIDYKKLKKYADDELQPLDIGRHAPKRNTELLLVDIKNILVEPKSKEIYEESSRICRHIIDVFFNYLKGQSSSSNDL